MFYLDLTGTSYTTNSTLGIGTSTHKFLNASINRSGGRPNGLEYLDTVDVQTQAEDG